MIPKSQRKIIEQKRNSRSRVVRNIINTNFGSFNRKIINQKRVGFAPLTYTLPANAVYFNGQPVFYGDNIVVND